MEKKQHLMQDKSMRVSCCFSLSIREVFSGWCVRGTRFPCGAPAIWQAPAWSSAVRHWTQDCDGGKWPSQEVAAGGRWRDLMTAVDRSVPVERDGDVTVAVSASADVANLASQSKYTARTQHVGAAQPLKLGCLETRCKEKLVTDTLV